MDYHLIVRMDDAIQFAREFRKQGIEWKRVRKGLWHGYNPNVIHGHFALIAGTLPDMVINIDKWNTGEPGKAVIIDRSKFRWPLIKSLKVDPPVFTSFSHWERWHFFTRPDTRDT